MRSDATKSKPEFRQAREWEVDPFTNQPRPDIDARYVRGSEETDRTRWHSFSGHERNSFFLNRAGGHFDNLSALSGLDNIADGRVWVSWDFDHDGFNDVALVNADYPLVNLYRNQIGDALRRPTDGVRSPADDAKRPAHAAPNFLAIRLQGGNQTARPQAALSARDAIGARLTLNCGAQQFVRLLERGEGFAAQNSATLVIGLAHHPVVDKLTIDWPSGQASQLDKVAANQLVRAFETAATSPHGQLFETSAYHPATTPAGSTRATAGRPRNLRLDVDTLLRGVNVPKDTQLLCFTTTATWCQACHRLQPQLQATRQRVGTSVQFFGVPIDPVETAELLTEFAREHSPAYQLLTAVDEAARDSVTSLVERLLKTQSLPCTLVTDREGRVLAAYLGVPNASELRRHLSTMASQ